MASLKNLAIAFDCDTQKGLFPHYFLEQENANLLNYIGPVPHKEDFPSSVTQEEYDNYVKSYTSLGLTWSFRAEAIKYCVNDCISLLLKESIN